MTKDPTTIDEQRELKLYQELKALLIIDKWKLDEAGERHADAYFRVSLAVEYAVSKYDEQLEKVADVESVVDAEIRHRMEMDDEKITEKNVESKKRLNAKVRAAREELKRLKILVGRWKALKASFDHRRDMLKLEAGLYASGYFGGHIGARQQTDDRVEDKRQRLKQSRRQRRDPE